MGLRKEFEEFRKKPIPREKKEVRSADEIRIDKARWELTIGFVKRDWLYVLRALRHLEE